MLWGAVLALFWGLSLAEAATQPTSGGEGILEGDSLNTCFSVKSEYAEQVCTNYKIHWKLWSLMGEPVGNYGLEWMLVGIRFKNMAYSLTVPEPLKDAAESIELYIDARAMVKSPNVDVTRTTAKYHRFNTGVAVKANKGTSYNSPGSPDWSKVFIHESPCQDNVRYATVDDARKVFSNSVTLSRLTICSGTYVNMLSFDAKVGRFCATEQGEGYPFCSARDKKRDKKVENSIDAAFSQLDQPKDSMTDQVKDSAGKGRQDDDIDKKLVRAGTYKGFADQCQQEMKEQTQCLENSCKQQPEERECLEGERVKVGVIGGCGKNAPAGTVCLGMPKYEFQCRRYSSDINPAFLTWKSCTENAGKSCMQGKSRITDIDVCVADKQALMQ